MKTPPLPPKWSYKKPFLTDSEDYPRYVLDQSGRLDRMYVAGILDNHGLPDYAAAWRGQDLTPLQLAAPELLEALQAAAELIQIARARFPRSIKNSDTFRLENTNAAINKAIHKATQAQ
jgi:hypothetical protein